MTRQRGTGVITAKGLEILAYIHAHSVDATPPALEFGSFIVSEYHGSTFAEITDPDYDYGLGSSQIPETFFLDGLGGGILAPFFNYTGDVTMGANPYAITGGSILPLLCQIPVNAVPNDFIDFYTVYIFVKNVITTDLTYNTDILFYSGCLMYDDILPATLYPITMISGMNMPLNLELFYTSGFPTTIQFNAPNNSLLELENHNTDDSITNHPDLRMAHLVDISALRYDVRRIFQCLTDNGLWP